MPQFSNKKPPCAQIKQKFLLLDLYKKPFYLLFPDNSDHHRTFIGMCFSLLNIFIVVIYAIYKFQDLITYNDYRLTKQTMENFYEETDAFTAKDGLGLAFGILDLNPSSDLSVDPEVGYLKLYYKIWDNVKGSPARFEEI